MRPRKRGCARGKSVRFGRIGRCQADPPPCCRRAQSRPTPASVIRKAFNPPRAGFDFPRLSLAIALRFVEVQQPWSIGSCLDDVGPASSNDGGIPGLVLLRIPGPRARAVSVLRGTSFPAPTRIPTVRLRLALGPRALQPAGSMDSWSLLAELDEPTSQAPGSTSLAQSGAPTGRGPGSAFLAQLVEPTIPGPGSAFTSAAEPTGCTKCGQS
jgi:hypothetical protein